MKKNVFVLVLSMLLMVGLIFSTPPGISAAGVSSGSQQWLMHQVEPGESLWKLGQKYGVTWQEIKLINGLQNDTIYAGQTLYLPLNRGTGKEAYREHIVKKGDTPWLVSREYDVSLQKLLALNGLQENSEIFPGQVLKIPYESDGSISNDNFQVYTVCKGDSPWLLSQKFGISLDKLLQVNNLNHQSIIYIGQQLKIPLKAAEKEPENEQLVYSDYYTVQPGDTAWNLSIKFGIPLSEFLQVNGLQQDARLYPGQNLKVPKHNIPPKETPGSKYGELLDWFKEAQYVWPMNTTATVVDFYTGKSWKVQRSYGASHADYEPLTASDAAIMKSVWGGSWSWTPRPVIVIVNGRRIAASAHSMPHSIEKIGAENNFYGHACIHFLNSKRHKDNLVDPAHQKCVRIAAGIEK